MILDMISFPSVIFFVSFLITIFALYFKAPIKLLEQIIAVFLIIILFFVKRFFLSAANQAVAFWYKNILLLFSSLIIQFIILSSGAFFSPFFILLHLYTLGTSFLLSLQASVSFLAFSLSALIISVWLNPELRVPIYEDPFTFALYAASLIVIIPLLGLLNRTYHIKDTIARVLSENLYRGQLREKSILQGLNELVLVTDKNLKIMSVNRAVEKTLGFSTRDIIGKKLLEILPLYDSKGVKVSENNLSINQMLTDKTSRIINGYFLKTGSKLPPEVSIQERPIVDLKGKIDQFVFVIKEGRLETFYSSAHRDLNQAHAKFEAFFRDFIGTLPTSNLSSIKLKAFLLKKIEEDILISQEIEDHLFEEAVSFPDVAEVCQQVLLEKQEFSRLLNIPLRLIFSPQDSAEMSTLSLRGQNIPKEVLTVSRYAVPIDPKWLAVVLEKLLDISILLGSGIKDCRVEFVLSAENGRTIDIEITTTPFTISQKIDNDLWTEYFGALGTTTNLRLGSGLEGHIVQAVLKKLNLNLNVSVLKYPPRLVMSLHLLKDRAQNTRQG